MNSDFNTPIPFKNFDPSVWQKNWLEPNWQGRDQIVTEKDVDQWQYLRDRHAPLDYPFMKPIVNLRDHVIIPFTYNHSVVGHCQRFLDTRIPKYINDIQPGYVFGTDLQNDAWNYEIGRAHV